MRHGYLPRAWIWSFSFSFLPLEITRSLTDVMKTCSVLGSLSLCLSFHLSRDSRQGALSPLDPVSSFQGHRYHQIYGFQVLWWSVEWLESVVSSTVAYVFPQGLFLAQDEVKELDSIEECYNTMWSLTWGPKALLMSRANVFRMDLNLDTSPRYVQGVPQKRKTQT